MKRSIQSMLVVSAVFAFAMAAFSARTAVASGRGHGTGIVHVFIRKAMHDEGVLPGAGGKVKVKRNQQGGADNQRLEIQVSGLEAFATYQLLAAIEDETNVVHMLDFETDGSGEADLKYRRVGNGNGRGLGHGKQALPNALMPVSDILELAIASVTSIVESNGVVHLTNVVLSADLTDPDKLHYLIKRDLGDDPVDGWLRIKATTDETQFRLIVSGLMPANEYSLVLNGDAVQTEVADANGGLRFDALPAGAPEDILDLRSLALWDSVSNAVLSTELP